MPDFCAWCALPLYGADRQPKGYEKEEQHTSKRMEVALCTKCKSQAEKEGWKESNRSGI